MRRLLLSALTLAVATAAAANGYEGTTRAKYTLGAMFTQSGSFGPPPSAADPFPCSAAVTAERSVYYNTTTHSIWFCNASAWTELGASSGITSPVSGDFVWLGKQTFGTAADAADSVRVGETAGAIVFEGSGADGSETTLGVTNPTADIRYNLPDAAAGTYSLLSTAAAVTLAQGGTGLTTAADDTVPVSSGAAWVASAVPACTDVTGNHLNYDAATNAFSCGTSSSGGIVSPVAGDFVWTGKGTWGSAADAANSVRLGETAGALVFEGATLDGFETTLSTADPAADAAVVLPATDGTLATLGNVAQTFANDITAPNVIGSTSLQAIATDGANSTTINATGITFEGSGVDAHETIFGVTNPTADLRYNLPDAVAGTYNILTSAAAVTLAQGGTGLTTAADDTVPVSSGAAWVASAVPNCVDTGGNHLNYTAATNAFSCGTSGTSTSTFSDAAFTLQDNGDATKQAQFQLSGITTGTTRTYTLRNESGTIPTLEGASGAWQAFGGYVSFAAPALVATAYLDFHTRSLGGGLGYSTVQTPDGVEYLTGTSSRSLRILEAADIAVDVSNGPCGTSACTDPSLILFSHNATAAEYVSLSHNGTNGEILTGAGSVVVRAGSGTGRAAIVGVLVANSTAVGNVGSGADTLMTYDLPANSLTINNEGVEIHAWGTTANNANAKSLVCSFGATAIQTTSLTASIAGVWDVRATVLRTGATGQVAVSTNSTQGAAGVALVDVESTSPAETLSGDVTIKCTGEATDNDDIVQRGLVVQYLN